MENYMIVLFSNKVRKKIIKKYLTFNKAKSFFELCKSKSNEVLFPKTIINGKQTTLEIGLIGPKNTNTSPVYLVDEFGRNVKVNLEDDNFNLLEVSEYKEEEMIYDLNLGKKINIHHFIKKYLLGDSIKMISSLNNKIIIQKNEDVYLFSLKTPDESKRFIDSLSLHFFKIKKGDCIFVKDVSSAQKKYLYNVLELKGIDKKILYRKFTTFPQ